MIQLYFFFYYIILTTILIISLLSLFSEEFIKKMITFQNEVKGTKTKITKNTVKSAKISAFVALIASIIFIIFSFNVYSRITMQPNIDQITTQKFDAIITPQY